MKKLILFLLIALSVQSRAQTLDTVMVRNLQLRAGDWAYLASHINGNDTTNIKVVRRIRVVAQGLVSPNFNTQVTVDSIPGRIVFQMYATVKNAPSGEYDAVGTNISTVIKAINNSALQYFIGALDQAHISEFTRKRNIGKNILLDN